VSWPLGRKGDLTPAQRAYRRRENLKALAIVAVIAVVAFAVICLAFLPWQNPGFNR
jgi:hypothetical protein